MLGSSLQNNPSVQTLVLEAEVLPLLYIRLQLEGEMKTVNRLVYALAGFVRSFERGIHRFLETEGLSRLLAVYRKTASEPGIREKIIVLLLDLINPDMLHHDLEEEKGDDSNKAARALSTVIDWFPTIDLEQWCLALEPVAVENDGTSAKELLKAFKAALEKRIQEEL